MKTLRAYEIKIGDVFTLSEGNLKLLFKQVKKEKSNKFNVFHPKTWFCKRYFIFEVIKNESINCL